MVCSVREVYDHSFGRIMNANIAEYHVPVNADIQDIKVIFVDEPDAIINPLGIKGLGEIGIVGVAAAIANAVFHATGVRVRDLPITLDKLRLRRRHFHSTGAYRHARRFSYQEAGYAGITRMRATVGRGCCRSLTHSLDDGAFAPSTPPASSSYQ
jgi:hypothetical protein